MSREIDAQRRHHCHTGATRLVAIQQYRSDLIRLAHQAGGRNAALAEKAQRKIPPAKADLESAWERYKAHVAECPDCYDREQVPA